jgi:uncharacterized membrane protein YgaE (UPF0421/DUF939 family)
MGRRGEEVLLEAVDRSYGTLRARLRRLRLTAVPILQSAGAAGLAWAVAVLLSPSPQPIFAPISALITLGASLSQRLRRTVELLIGVALGILSGDLLILVIGTGALQITVVVTLAMTVSVLVGGSNVLISQAASSAVLVATLVPPTTGGIYYTRFVEALIGGTVGIVVNALVLPLNPVAIVRRAADPVLNDLAAALELVAYALRSRNPAAARTATDHGWAAQEHLNAFAEALEVGNETSRIAPLRWRSQGHLGQYLNTSAHLEHAVRNVRVLLRRAAALLAQDEPVPPGLPDVIDTLAHAVRALRDDLARSRYPRVTREDLLRACHRSAGSLHGARTLSGQVMVAQVRSTAVDLLEATGLDHAEADRAVRRAMRSG